MPEQVDVVIVGARCAGAPLAADLAQRGLRVCVIERARFPSEVPSTHVLQPSAAQHLQRLGLLDDIFAAGALPLMRGRFVIDDAELAYDGDVMQRLRAPPVCVRRTTLDTLLVAAAENAGATVRTGTAATGLEIVDGTVRGVLTDAGTIEAPLVVGADGPNSTVARFVGARKYHVTPPGRVVMWGYFDGVPASDEVRLGKVGDIGFLGAPTDGGLYLAAVAFNMARRREILADMAGSYDVGLREVGYLDAAVVSGQRVGPIRMMARWHGYFREAAGTGWCLVGDAGHFKDPTPAQGISDAFRQAACLASAIEHGLGRGTLQRELESWWRWRDADAWDMYWFGAFLGAPGPTPELAKEMLRRLAASEGGPELFLRVMNHEVSPVEVFGPRGAASAIAASAVGAPRKLPVLALEAGRLLADRVVQRWLRRRPIFAGSGTGGDAEEDGQPAQREAGHRS